MRMESCCHSAQQAVQRAHLAMAGDRTERHYLCVPSTVPSCMLLYGHLRRPGPK